MVPLAPARSFAALKMTFELFQMSHESANFRDRKINKKVPKVDNCVISKRIRKQKSYQKAVFSRYIFSENSSKRYLAQPGGHRVTQKRLRDNKHTFEAIFQLTRVVVNYRKGQKELKKLFYIQRELWPDHLSTTDRMLSTVSPGIPASTTKPSSFLSFVQPDKKVFGRVAKS